MLKFISKDVLYRLEEGETEWLISILMMCPYWKRQAVN